MQQKLNLTVALGAIDRLSAPVNAARAASRELGAAIKSTQNELRAFTQQTRQLDRAEAEILKKNAAMTRALEARKQLQAQPVITEEQKAQIAQLGREIGKINRQIKSEKEYVTRVTAALEQYGVSARNGGDITGQIAAQTERYNRQLQTQEAQLNRVTAAQNAYDRARKRAERIRNTGLKMGAAGGGILWGALRGMRPGMEFDQAYSQTLADAQLTRSSAEGQALRSQAKYLARTTHYNAVQATQGQDALISGGLTAENARKALPGVLNMALAAHADLGQAANVGSGIFDAFQMDASQMDRVGDVLVATFTRSKTSLESLGETMKYAGPVAHQAGISLEETAAATAMLAKNGLEGSMAGTGLKSVVNGLYAPAKAGAEILDTLKIRTVTATGALRPMADVLQELMQKIRGYNKGSQLDIFKNLFGEEGMGAGMILARAMSEGQFQDFRTYLMRAQGLSARTAQVMTDNFDGDMQMLHSAWAGLWTQLEEGADAPLRRVVEKITSAVQSVTDWISQHPVLTQILVMAALVSGAVLAMGGTLLATLGMVLGPLAAVRLSLSLLGGESLGLVGGAVETLGGIFSGVFGTVATVLAGISAPVWGLIAVFAVAAVAVIKWWAPVKAFFGGVLDGFFEAVAPLMAVIRVVWGGLCRAFSLLWDKITGFLTPLQATRGMLDKCAGAGKAFGHVLGVVFRAAAVGLEGLMRGLAWLLEKLGVIPDAAAAIQRETEKMRQQTSTATDEKDTTSPVVPETSPALPTGLLKKPEMPDFGTLNFTLPDTPKHKKGRTPRLPASSAPGDTGQPGEIVFKSLPSWVALNNGFRQPVLADGHAGMAGMHTAPAGEVTTTRIGTRVDGDINLHIHVDGAHMDRRELVNDIERQIMAALNRLKRQDPASLADRE